MKKAIFIAFLAVAGASGQSVFNGTADSLAVTVNTTDGAVYALQMPFGNALRLSFGDLRPERHRHEPGRYGGLHELRHGGGGHLPVAIRPVDHLHGPHDGHGHFGSCGVSSPVCCWRWPGPPNDSWRGPLKSCLNSGFMALHAISGKPGRRQIHVRGEGVDPRTADDTPGMWSPTWPSVWRTRRTTLTAITVALSTCCTG